MRVFNSSILAAALTGLTLSAQTIVVPAGTDVNNGSSGSTFPFGRDSATATSNDIRIQEVYDSSSFALLPGPIVITGLRFRADDAAVTSTWTGGDFSNSIIRIGEAGIDYSALATGAAFSATYVGGVEPAPAYSGPITVVAGAGLGSGVPGLWYISVTLTTPVLYDPASGNDLCIDIQHDGVFTGTTSGAFSTNTDSNAARRMYNSTDATSLVSSGFTSNAAVCELSFTPVAGIFANFTASATDVFPGDVVTFTDTSFTSHPGGIVAWDWDFNGDGIIDSTLQNPTWTYTSSQCGANDVTLTVTDATSSSTRTLSNYVSVNAPTASFTASTLTGPAPLVVNFTDTSLGATAWSWDLDGDGVFGDDTTQNPVWVYTTNDLTTVTLRASNSCGTSESSVTIVTGTGLQTQYGGIVGWASGGFYFDVDVLNPAGISVLGLGVQIQNPGVPALIDVYAKQGSHVGAEGNAELWTKVATGTAIGAGSPNETIVNVNDFALAAGQWALVVHYQLPAGERFNYTSSGTTSAGNADIQLANGRMNALLFDGGTTFSPRNWNGTIYYNAGISAGDVRPLGGGCANSTGEISVLNLQGGAPRVGTTLAFEVSRAPASQPLSAVLFGVVGFGGIDLGVIGMPGCGLHPDPLVSLPAPTDASGVGVALLPLAANPAAIGLPIQAQVFTADPGTNPFGAVLSSAIAGTLGAN